MCSGAAVACYCHVRVCKSGVDSCNKIPCSECDERNLQNNHRLLAGASLVALWLISKCRSVLFGESSSFKQNSIIVEIFITLTSTHHLLLKRPESILSLSPHGLQLEAHRGIPPTPITRSIPLFTSRRFIPLPSINDIIINEALYGWNVRYYLAVLCTVNEGFAKGGEKIVVRVIFEVSSLSLRLVLSL